MMSSSTASLFAEPPVVLADTGTVMAALKTIRVTKAGLQETELHDDVCAALAQAKITYRREYSFGPRCRADVWVDGIVIEVKKQRPARAKLLAQLLRYAEQPQVRAIVLVLERSVPVPSEIEGKPVFVVSLNALWGIAL
jgi:hypothetical protein